MLAISAVDCALWDIKGKWLGQPVYRLIGGPTRDSVPAYASMLGYAVRDLGLVRERARHFKDLGYSAQKWFFRHGPMSGYDGLRENVALVKTLRETLGEGYDIMLDCWQAMDVSYVVDLAERIAEYRPRWLEECVMPDRIDSYRRIKDSTNIPLSGAEHEYTRWGFVASSTPRRWMCCNPISTGAAGCRRRSRSPRWRRRTILSSFRTGIRRRREFISHLRSRRSIRPTRNIW